MSWRAGVVRQSRQFALTKDARNEAQRDLSHRGRGGCMMSGRLSGKVCVITGTGGSVGRATALAFAREGASVVGCDVKAAAAEATVEMVRAHGGTMISLQPCHLTEPSECQALVDLAVREYGRI